MGIDHRRLLTPFELDVLELYAEGYKAPEIADRLGITRRTVKNYSDRLRGKLGARTMAQAVAMVLAP